MPSDTTIVSTAAVFSKKTAITAVFLEKKKKTGQKTLHWQLSKVILSGMYNYNFEAINEVLNKRMKK